MLDIGLAIFCSASLVLLFKVFERNGIDSFQAIVFNYFVCVITGYLTAQTPLNFASIPSQEWFPFACICGVFFILIFHLIALTTQRNGVTVASVANKLSMVIFAVTAFFLYDEPITFLKVSGIVLAVFAVFLSSIRSKDILNEEGQHIETKKPDTTNLAYLILPIAVCLSAGLVDSLIGYVEEYHLPSIKESPLFLICIFGIAGIIGCFALLKKVLSNKEKIVFKNILGGIALGIPNYGSTYFFVKAMGSSGLDKSTVVPIINIGVIAFASGIAYLFFNEKLSTLNLIGILLALLAIVFMSMPG